MYKDAKAANMAAYFLFKAGAAGLSRRRLLALMYLAERNEIKCRDVPSIGDSYMLTEHGPVMKEAYGRIMGGLEHSPGAHREWDRLAEAREPAMVADADAAYAARPASSATDERLVIRNPQPPIRWVHDGTLMDPPPDEWDGQDEGMPYFGTLSRADHENLAETWRLHGERDEDDLIQHALELPECDGAVYGNLPFSTILKVLGYTQREIKETLKFAYENGITSSPDA